MYFFLDLINMDFFSVLLPEIMINHFWLRILKKPFAATGIFVPLRYLPVVCLLLLLAYVYKNVQRRCKMYES